MFISLYLTLNFFDFFLKFLVVHPDDQILKSGCPERNLVVIDDRTSVIFSSALVERFVLLHMCVMSDVLNISKFAVPGSVKKF